MTANNITYAVFSKPAGLFGNDQGLLGFLRRARRAGAPAGVGTFATVTESAAEGVATGDRFYGYYLMAEDAVLTVSKAGPGGLPDVTRVAPPLPPSTTIISGSRRCWAIAPTTTILAGVPPAVPDRLADRRPVQDEGDDAEPTRSLIASASSKDGDPARLFA